MGGAEGSKGVSAKKFISSLKWALPGPSLAQLKKRLVNLETAYKGLRKSTADWPNKQGQLAAIGKHVGDMHRAVNRATVTASDVAMMRISNKVIVELIAKMKYEDFPKEFKTFTRDNSELKKFLETCK